jgi:putative glycerol-1-phosphate prenyltransferase
VSGATLEYLLATSRRRGAVYLVLLDPDRLDLEAIERRAAECAEAGADALLVGTSLTLLNDVTEVYRRIRRSAAIPVITFPGSGSQLSPAADAVLFLSMISSRNPELLIGEHVRTAPALRRMGVEVISTAYALVESGTLTSVQYMSGSLPIPRDKTDIAVAHALAAEYIGMRLLYLEAGSGASQPVPDAMVRDVAQNCRLPVIVGGGIRDPRTARAKVESGASFVVTGQIVEQADSAVAVMRELAAAVHTRG